VPETYLNKLLPKKLTAGRWPGVGGRGRARGARWWQLRAAATGGRRPGEARWAAADGGQRQQQQMLERE
jgi:hypothetical protein